MVGAVAGAAAVFGLVATGAEVVRRRLATKARIARRLAPQRERVTERLLRVHDMPIVPAMPNKADAA